MRVLRLVLAYLWIGVVLAAVMGLIGGWVAVAGTAVLWFGMPVSYGLLLGVFWITMRILGIQK